MPRLAKTDVLFAHIALHIVPGLSASARRVGAAIIEHFNKRTGQCDPSIERLARLLGISATSVKDATAELCRGEDALFERVVHGGRSHRTAYLPRWDRFNDLIDDWDLRLRDGSGPKGSRARRDGTESCAKTDHEKGRKTGSLRAGNPAVNEPEIRPQTVRSNRQKKPKAMFSLSARDPQTSQEPNPNKGLMRESKASGQAPILLPIVGGKGAAKADAAEAARHRRVADEISQLPKHERAAAWLAAMGER